MRTINVHQKNLYEEYERQGSQRYFDRYKQYLEPFRQNQGIRILDIGGASGYFAMLLKSFFQENGAEVYVLDITAYDTWTDSALGRDIHFICDSVENLDKHFSSNTFDIVFANRVFHHFIDESWCATLTGMDRYLHAIRNLLKDNGTFFIMDHFYNGMIMDAASSFLIYSLTSIQDPVLSRIVKKLGAETAGVGVCFQSEKMWVNRIQKCGFDILLIEKSKYYKLGLLKRLGLMNKEVSKNNILCAVPSKKH